LEQKTSTLAAEVRQLEQALLDELRSTTEFKVRRSECANASECDR
jgi:hypothetical protein